MKKRRESAPPQGSTHSVTLFSTVPEEEAYEYKATEVQDADFAYAFQDIDVSPSDYFSLYISLFNFLLLLVVTTHSFSFSNLRYEVHICLCGRRSAVCSGS